MKNRKYTGLQEAIAEMPTYDRHNGLYIEVSYDLDNDEVLAEVYVDFGMWSHTRYESPRIIFQNTNPERGRKRHADSTHVDSPSLHFRTQTPKGDGNTCDSS